MNDSIKFPIGQRINLPGHFPEPVVLESVRSIGAGYECRVRLTDGIPDEAILSLEEATSIFEKGVKSALGSLYSSLLKKILRTNRKEAG